MSVYSLRRAQEVKNDEFYTMYKDVAFELDHYTGQFKDKVVYLPCDDYRKSQFWVYFHNNFSKLGLKELISTYYDTDNAPIKAVYCGGNDSDILNCETYYLEGDGDFRSEDIIDIISYCDIIVTNPPFSLLRSLISILIDSGKKFIIWGSTVCLGYSIVFENIKSNIIGLGYTLNKALCFNTPDNNNKQVNCITLTNMICSNNLKKLNLTYKYDKGRYPEFYNYKGINVDRIKDIPCDYEGIIGVPITILLYNYSDYFDILGITKHIKYKSLMTKTKLDNIKSINADGKITDKSNALNDYILVPRTSKHKGICYVDINTGCKYRSIFARVFIKRKRII